MAKIKVKLTRHVTAQGMFAGVVESKVIELEENAILPAFSEVVDSATPTSDWEAE